MQKLNLILSSLNDSKDEKAHLNTLVKYNALYSDVNLLDEFLNRPYILAGGKALERFSPEIKGNDYDIWCPEPDKAVEQVQEKISKLNIDFKKTETEYATTFRMNLPHQFVLQIMKAKVTCPKLLLNSFDLSICSVAIHFKTKTIAPSYDGAIEYTVPSHDWVYSEDFVRAIDTKTLGIKKKTKSRRIVKYVSKGLFLSATDVKFLGERDSFVHSFSEEQKKAEEDYENTGEKIDFS